MTVYPVITGRCNFSLCVQICYILLSGKLELCSDRSLHNVVHCQLLSCCTGSILCGSLLGYHLIEYLGHPLPVRCILRRRDIVHINTVLEQTGTHLSLFQTAFLQLLPHLGHHQSRLCTQCERQYQQYRSQKPLLHIMMNNEMINQLKRFSPQS